MLTFRGQKIQEDADGNNASVQIELHSGNWSLPHIVRDVRFKTLATLPETELFLFHGFLSFLKETSTELFHLEPEKKDYLFPADEILEISRKWVKGSPEREHSVIISRRRGSKLQKISEKKLQLPMNSHERGIITRDALIEILSHSLST